jgi:acetylornithine/succinyldiaminopimelate/putrescine aminotransferase
MLGKLLSVVRLDKVYTKAEENYLYYTDNTGEIIKVVDFLGGYGASLFGHNNEELVQTALDFFKNKIPFNAQASCRGKSALLGEKLNNMMYERNNKSYITTLANTGTEAVEVAIKHAELYRINNLKKIYNETEQQVIKARKIC